MKMKGQSDTVYVKYNTFEITNEATKYVLKINGFSRNVTDNPRGMDYNNNIISILIILVMSSVLQILEVVVDGGMLIAHMFI